MKVSDGYIVVGAVNATVIDGDIAGVSGLGSSSEAFIIKFDNNFNVIWRNFFKGSLAETFLNVIATSDNGYIVSGISESNNYDMAGIGYTTPGYQTEAIVVKYDSNGNMLLKKSFRGSRTDAFQDMIEVSDGYIIAGYSNSCDQDMIGICKIDNSVTDAIIVKFDKTLSNILWKKSFGGSSSDTFTKILKINDSEVIAVGSSISEDMDMNNIAISKDGYKNAIIVKYNTNNGDVTSKKVFGGSNSDSFNSIIRTTNNGYMVAGTTFSSNNNLKNFNKGHSDAILVSYDDNLELQENLKEPVVIIDKLKAIVPNYGTSISTKYNYLYTSNDPTINSGGWCTSTIGVENSSNYTYGYCLFPYNVDDIKTLTAIEVSSGLRIYQGEREYSISVNANNNYNWHQIIIHLAGSTGTVEVSNLKLKFADGYIGSISSAVDNGYIQPLVIVHNLIIDTRVSGLFPNIMNIINNGGSAGTADYPLLGIKLKPKKSQLTGVIFTSSKNSVNHDGVKIEELRNFDMSITPTQ